MNNRILLFLSTFLFFINSNFANTYTAKADGKWEDPATWDQNAVPSSIDEVVIDGYTVTINSSTGNVTINNIEITNKTNPGGSRLLIDDGVTVNASAVFVYSEDQSGDVELVISGNATVVVVGNVLYERKSGNTKNDVMGLFIQESGQLQIGGTFFYKYFNSGTGENQVDILLEDDAQLIISNNLDLYMKDGQGVTFQMTGQSSLQITKELKMTLEDGGDMILDMSDTSSLTVNGNTTIVNKSGANDLKITTDLDKSTIQFNGKLILDSDDANSQVSIENNGSTIFDVDADISMHATGAGYTFIQMNDSSTLKMSGNFDRSENYGALNMGNNANLVFDGTGFQRLPRRAVSGSGADVFTISRMYFNNTSGDSVVLEGDVVVTEHLEIINGVIETTDAKKLILGDGATITGGSSTAYIDGPVMKQGSTNGSSFVFPLGNDGVYAPLEMSVVSNPTYEYQAQYFSDPPPIEDGISPPLEKISSSGYWSVAKSTGATDPDFSLHWTDAAASGINDPDSLLVAGLKDNGATKTWESYGNSGTSGGTGSGVGGSVTTALAEPPPLDEVTLLTIGTINAGSNALPVTLSRFGAVRIGENVQLDWVTIFERDASHFIVERSSDGKTFLALGQIATAGNSSESKHYIYKDESPQNGVNYYRLKQIDYDGRYAYSEVISIDISFERNKMKVYPNPARKAITIEGLSKEKETIRVTLKNQIGKTIFDDVLPVRNGMLNTTGSQLLIQHGGVYYLQLGEGNQIQVLPLIFAE